MRKFAFSVLSLAALALPAFGQDETETVQNSALWEASHENIVPGVSLERVRELILQGEDVHEPGLLSNIGTRMYLFGAKGLLSKEPLPISKEVAEECAKITTLLIQSGADPNKPDPEDGDLPLGEPVPLEVLEALIEGGADVNGRDNDGDPALSSHLISGEGKIRALIKETFEDIELRIALLLKHGADPNAFDGDKKNGRVAMIHLAAMFGTANIINLLVESGADITVKDKSIGAIALQYVFGSHRLHRDKEYELEKLKAIIALHKKPKKHISFEAKDSELRRTAMFGAVLYGLPESITLLAEAGAKVDARDKWNHTPLHVMCNWQSDDDEELLKYKPIIQSKDEFLKEHTIVFLDSLEALLESGAKPNLLTKVQSGRKIDCLYLAQGNDKYAFEIMELLVRYKANLNTYGEDGQTPIMRAINFGNFEIFDMLAKNGANLKLKVKGGKNEKLYGYGLWALQAFAADRDGSLEIAEELVKLKVKPNYKSRIGMTELMICAMNGEPGARVAEHLIEVGAKLNVQDTEGMTALLWSVYYDNPELVTVLVRAGVNKRIKHPESQLTAYELAKDNYSMRGVLLSLKP